MKLGRVQWDMSLLLLTIACKLKSSQILKKNTLLHSNHLQHKSSDHVCIVCGLCIIYDYAIGLALMPQSFNYFSFKKDPMSDSVCLSILFFFSMV